MKTIFPKSVELVSTTRCQLCCEHCFRIREEENEINLNWCEIVTMMNSLGVERISITGGEPTLLGTEYLISIINSIKSLGMECRLYTNAASLKYDEICNLIKNLDLINLSLDPQNLKNSSCRGNCYNEKLKEILNILINNSFEKAIQFLTVVTKENVNDVQAVGEFISDLELKKIKIIWKLNLFSYRNSMPKDIRKRFFVDEGDYLRLYENLVSKFCNITIAKCMEKNLDLRYLFITPSRNLFTVEDEKYLLVGSISKNDVYIMVEDFKWQTICDKINEKLDFSRRIKG
jgi:MoaA/NifB/PqqE/SkfB family radical SAM enzyme